MSILKVAYATPSRIKGVIRYLLQARGEREKRDILEAILSPEALINKGNDKEPSRSMIKETIRESIKMGLLEESQDKSEVFLNLKPKLKNDCSLPSILSQLLLNQLDNTENHDFGKVLAWYLAQDFFDAPGNWQETEQRLREQIGSDLLDLNDVRYGQFEDWSCYLGFSWKNALIDNPVLVPDPTAYLRENIDKIFENQSVRQIPLGEFINLLGKYCPVFETGELREEIEQQIGLREPNHLSSVTSVMLRRLEDEGLIKLERLSDTSILVLRDGSGDSRISHITWLHNNSNGGRP